MEVLLRIWKALNPANAAPGAPVALNWLYAVVAAAAGIVVLACQLGISNPVIPCPTPAETPAEQ